MEARVRGVLRDLCEQFADSINTAGKIIDQAMKKLELPTSNPTVVFLMHEGLRKIQNEEMRHRQMNPNAGLDEQQINLFGPHIQDKYVVIRNGEYVQVPRAALTEFECYSIIKLLRKIGSTYLRHADELQKETESRFNAA